VTKPGGFFKSRRCRSEGKAINYLVAATVERHDKNSGCGPVELSLLSFILGIHLACDVNLGLELASEHSAGFPVTSDRQTSIAHCRGPLAAGLTTRA